MQISRLNLLKPALLTFAVIVATPAEAQSQSYTFSTSSRTFSSISGFGTQATLLSGNSDEGYYEIPLPAGFTFYGATQGGFAYATTNGLVNFDGDISYATTTLPSSGAPNGFIAPFWDDLVVGTAGIYYYQQGSGASASVTIEWNSVTPYMGSDLLTFQVILYGSGNIEIVYGPRSASPTAFGGVGVEDPTGTLSSGPICNSSCSWTSDLTQGTVFSFVPGAGPPPTGVDLQISSLDTLPPSTWTEGTNISFSATAYNAGNSAAAGSYASVYIGSSPTGVTLSDYRVPNSDVYVSSVGAGLTSSVFFSFTVPTGYTGSWHYAVIADSYNDLVESIETNNILQGGVITISGGTTSAITITNSSVPNGQVGISYNTQLMQTGGVSPSWFLTSGNLPQGITMSSTGLLSGIPSVAGTATFTVSCEEAGKTPGTRTFSLTVTNGSSGLSISPSTIPPAIVGVPYSATLTGSGGAPPYAFQIITGRPEWLMLTGQGVFSGTPPAAGNFQFTVSLFDSNSMDATQVYDLVVTAPTGLALATEIPAAVTNRPYSAQVVNGGIPPYNITITSGTLPTGLMFNTQGQLTGTPIAMANTTVNIAVTDANTPQGMVSGPVLVRVSMLSALAITSDELVVYVKTDNAKATLQATGGVPPYRWALVEGTLPAGLRLDPELGDVTGRVELTGTTTATVAVTDSEGSRAEKRILVKAQVFRSNSGDNSNNRSGGCSCDATATSERKSVWAGFVLLGLLVWRRRR